MFTHNFAVYGTKILAELAMDIIFFPFWWYSRGFMQLLKLLKNLLSNQQKSLALLVWIKNIFRPMYGQHDWQGMLISFFMRLVQIIFRSIVMLVWSSIALVIAIFWLALPILVIYEIIFQLFL